MCVGMWVTHTIDTEYFACVWSCVWDTRCSYLSDTRDWVLWVTWLAKPGGGCTTHCTARCSRDASWWNWGESATWLRAVAADVDAAHPVHMNVSTSRYSCMWRIHIPCARVWCRRWPSCAYPCVKSQLIRTCHMSSRSWSGRVTCQWVTSCLNALQLDESYHMWRCHVTVENVTSQSNSWCHMCMSHVTCARVRCRPSPPTHQKRKRKGKNPEGGQIWKTQNERIAIQVWAQHV